MGHVKNRQAGTEDKAEELDHTVEVNDELKKHINRMWESLGLSYRVHLGFKSWAQKKNAIAKALKVEILEENFLNLEKR